MIPERLFPNVARVLLVLVAYAALLLVTTSVVGIGGSTPDLAQRSGSERLQGLPVVALASAGLLAWIVLRSSWSGPRLALGLAFAFFGAHTILPELDALARPTSYSAMASGSAARWLGGALFAATFASTAVVILRRPRRSEVEPLPNPAGSVVTDAVRVAVAAAIQLLLHAAWGCRWGWYPPAEGGGLQGPPGLLCPNSMTLDGWRSASAGGIDVLRALIWALIGLALVRLLRRGAMETSLAVGAFFALAAPVRQLLPSPLVSGDWASARPWALGMSQLALGMGLALWLRRPRLGSPAPRHGGWLHRKRAMPPQARGAPPAARVVDSKGLEG